MPLYENREGGRVRERVRAVPGRFEDTRLGVMHHDREQHGRKDGWHLVDESKPTARPAARPSGDADGG
jgi:hypothetical protein